MGYVAARCPNCAGDLQLDDKMEKGYCTHCGTPIYFKDAIQKIKIVGPVEIAGFAKLDSLIKLIKKDLEFGMNQTGEFRDRLNRALELDPSNQYLYDLQSSEVWNAKISEGRLLSYKSSAEKIFVPDCVSVIERSAFKTCYNLKEVILPRSITFIDDSVFYKEENLTISAYKNTYAARYALVSPAYLNIIDDDENNQEYIRKIEEHLTEIVAFKNVVVGSINRHYFSKFYFRILWPFILPALLAAILFRWQFLLQTATGKLLIFIIAVSVGSLFMFSRGYIQTCRKLAAKNQIMRFYKKCNDLLGPLGIVDFKYLKNIWECSNTNLKYESKHMEKIKSQILNTNTKEFLKNTYIDLSFLSYIAGNRPKDIDKKY